MDWSTLAVSRALLDQTNAFVDANDAEDRGLQLLDPTTAVPEPGSLVLALGALVTFGGWCLRRRL